MSIKELANGAVLVPPDGGKLFWVHGLLADIKATDAETRGTYSLVEITLAPAPVPGPPLHIHKSEDEAFYVLDGTVNVQIGDDTVVGEPGAFIFMPRGTVHRFWNPSSTPTRFLTIFSPPGFEGFLQEVGEPASGRVLPEPPEGSPDRHRFVAIANKYNMELVPPPEQ